VEWKVWHAAAEQIFFSLGPGFGIVTALASHNPTRNAHGYHVVTDAVVVTIVNSVASLLAGIAVFSILGHFSLKFNVRTDYMSNAQRCG
jgi:SNF family Na+-dependent transporter